VLAVVVVPLVLAAIAHPPAPRQAAAVRVAIVRFEESNMVMPFVGVMETRLNPVSGKAMSTL
jgi:ABC-type transport system involved in cytochrome c biogenesis permease subunit